MRNSALLALALCLSQLAHGQETGVAFTNAPAAETIDLPKSVPDPLEPFNRVMWGFNKAVMTGVIKPSSRVYRFVVRKPVRKGIGNFGKNLTYPGRLINNLLQGKWTGARDESYRFLCNTTVGVAGVFDVASKWDIPKSDADFGQTFGQWGWKPGCFLMLPIFGPSNERDTVGLAADIAANPLFYIAPYKFDAHKPLTYLGPYTYFTYAVMYNNLSDSVGEYVRFSQAEMDPYSTIQYAWTFARENRVADFRVKGEPDEAALETLESVFFTPKDAEFPFSAKTRSVLIPTTGRKLKFTFWLQPGKAPVVYIVPGLGSHRLAQPSQALAELVYKNGFSAVCISSPFNFEFMEQASSVALPAYLPVDGRDMHVAFTEIDHKLRALYPNRLGDTALMGYSMGALQSLFVAASDAHTPSAPEKEERAGEMRSSLLEAPPHEPRSAAVPAASSRGVPPLEKTRGGTPRELAGADACATNTIPVQGFKARTFISESSLPGPLPTRSSRGEGENSGQLPLIQFDRHVAINTPVRMAHGISILDEFYLSPLDWPATNRTDNIENTFLKVAALSKTTLTPHTSLPFNAIESRFLIGLTFRFALRDIIFSSQQRNNQGVLQQPIRKLRRDPVYQEILQYSYQDYFEKFAIPYYWSRGIEADTIEQAGDLRTYEAALRDNPNIHVIVNQNDFLLADEDLAWLRTAIAPERLTVFAKGGHLGNLLNPTVQKSILRALANMKSFPDEPLKLPTPQE